MEVYELGFFLFLEGVEAAVVGVLSVPETGRLEDVALVGVLFEERLVEDLKGVYGLVVEGDKLDAAGPEVDRREVGGVEAAGVRVASD